MLLLNKKIEELQIALEEQKGKIIQEYSIHIRLNNIILVYVVCDNKSYTLPAIDTQLKMDCVIYSKERFEESGTNALFAEPIAWNNSRRRLTDASPLIMPNFSCPVVTFYSYKGGMGRTTTIASYAAHLAMNEGKRVFILDCDLEAPGFTNFFLKNPGEAAYQNGLVEYLMDRSFTGKTPDIKDYIRTVEGDYTGSKGGAIFIMPAGNTDPHIYDAMRGIKVKTDDLKDYIEGLARLPLTQPKEMAVQLGDIITIITEANNEYRPDVILIDSRTGFNDIFAATALHLSDFVLGFFGTSAQNHTGLHHFIETITKLNKTRKPALAPLLVNSIVATANRYDSKEDFADLLEAIMTKFTDEDMVPNLPENVTVWRNEILEEVGSPREKLRYFIELIRDKEFKAYKELFALLDDRVFEKKKIMRTPT